MDFITKLLLYITNLKNVLVDHLNILQANKLEKGTYSGNASDIVALINQIEVPEIVDALDSTFSDKTLSANQGRILYGFITELQSVLASDDVNLDEFQEIVDFIKQNKNDLQNLTISNIAGLQTALNGKEDAFSKNTAFNKNFGTGANDVAKGNHAHTADEITETATRKFISLGETSNTAYRGDRGKLAYDHSVAMGDAATPVPDWGAELEDELSF